MPEPKSKVKTPGEPRKNGKKAKPAAPRSVMYPAYDCKICEGKDALTLTDVQTILGWEEETEKVKFGDAYLFIDRRGKKIRTTRNGQNREFRPQHADELTQDLLKSGDKIPQDQRPWQVNGENVIIGEYGSVLSAQHRFVALAQAVFAYHGWKDGKQSEVEKAHWAEYWSHEPTLETFIAFGIKERPEVLRTIDNVLPRSIGDVFYTSPLFRSDGVAIPNKDRSIMCRMIQFAVKLLWVRTGARSDAFTPHQTHSEAVAFVDHHPKLVECVKHVFEENSVGAISKYVSPGYASALLYLMGASASDGDEYRLAEHPSESKLNWDNWAKAEEYWTCLAAKSSDIEAIRMARKPANTSDDANEYDGLIFASGEGSGGSIAERIGTLCRGWSAFLNGEKIVPEVLKMYYKFNDDGEPILKETPTVFGIDFGNPKDDEDKDEAEDDTPEAEVPPTPTPIKPKAPKSEKPLTAPMQSAAHLIAELEKFREEYPGRVLLFKSDSGTGYYLYGEEDVTLAHSLLKLPKKKYPDNLPRATFASQLLDYYVERLTKGGKAVCVLGSKGEQATLYEPSENGEEEAGEAAEETTEVVTEPAEPEATPEPAPPKKKVAKPIARKSAAAK